MYKLALGGFRDSGFLYRGLKTWAQFYALNGVYTWYESKYRFEYIDAYQCPTM